MRITSITYYKLKMLDGKWHIHRRIEQPPMIIEDLFSIANETEAQKMVDSLNAEQKADDELHGDRSKCVSHG